MSHSLEPQIKDYLLALPTAQAQQLSDIAADDSLLEMNLFDSLSLLAFVVFIEKECQIKIPGEDVSPDNFGSLQAVGQYLLTEHNIA